MQPKYPKPAACEGCELQFKGFGFAPDDGPVSRLNFLAEALGPEEAFHGRPLVGAAGGVHTRLLARAGIARESTRADNCIRCMPPGMWFDEDAPYYYAALNHCAFYRSQSFQKIPDNGVLVTYGAVALKTALNLHGVEGVNVKDFHGTVHRDPTNRFWIVPTFHPSHLQRGAMSLLEIVTNDLRLANRIADQGFKRTAYTLVVDPSVEWFHGWVDRHLGRLATDPDACWLALDTEFPEKLGADESEIDAPVPDRPALLRYNVANTSDEGVTVPATPPFAAEVQRLLDGCREAGAFVFLWNKYADIDQLRAAGHALDDYAWIDLMWLVHYLQSDLPRGLGFWAPVFSDLGAWKHWSKVREQEGPYAAADSIQTFRGAVWAVKAAMASGMWDVFLKDWHERDYFVLRPSRAMGVPMDRPALEQFHATLQEKQAAILAKIKTIGAEGSLKPKAGYAKKPKGKPCEACAGSGCPACGGSGSLPPVAPNSVLGIQKGKTKSEAKQAYTREGVTLVERDVIVSTRCCAACGSVGVGPKHRCKGTPKGTPNPAQLGDRLLPGRRWFWCVPFNPSSWQQILAYIERKGHTPGTARKSRKPSTDKESLKKLAVQTGDPLYQLLLDGRAVEKVDGTYAMGSLKRLDADNRLHPEVLPVPSTLRDSSRGPNLQNVVADKAKGETLASGFRRCVKARDGVPAGVTEEEFERWKTRWLTA